MLIFRRPTANLEDTALPERAARRGRAEPVPISGPHGSHAGPIHRWKKRSRSRGGWDARTGLGAAQEEGRQQPGTVDSVCELRQSAHGHQHRQQQQRRGAEQFAEGLYSSVLPIASEPTGIDRLVALLEHGRSISRGRAPCHPLTPTCSKAQRAPRQLRRRNGRNSATSRLWPHSLNSPSPMTTTTALLFRLAACELMPPRQPKAMSKKHGNPTEGTSLKLEIRCFCRLVR